MVEIMPPLADWPRARRRWRSPAFAAARAGVDARIAAARDHDLRPVAEAGGWGHAFFCPDHVEPLEFDPSRPSGHRCPVDGHRWEGADVDGGWVCTLNARIMGALQASALRWRLTDADTDRDWAVSTLLRYAELYPDLPPAGRWVGRGRVTGQSLEEAVWALGVLETLDRLGDGLTDTDLDRIRTGLLAPLAEHLVAQRLVRIHNIECWHLAALAGLGVALDDTDLIALAVDGPNGLHAQFDHGILADGWWVEGSPHYHFYMATTMLHAVRLLRLARPDLAERADLRDMLITPLSLLRPDLSLPALNDGWHRISEANGIGPYAAHYELAHRLWDDARFASVLAAMGTHGQPRDTDAALLFGPDPTDTGPTATDPDTGTRPDAGDAAPEWPRRDLHPASGYAVLRDEDPGGRFLVLKYGPHGGGHGHPDKLQLDWWADGTRLAPDAGSPAYTSPLQGPWFRQTLAHNTVVIDGESQPPGTGRLIEHRPPLSGSIGVADAWIGWRPGSTPEAGGSWLSEPRRDDVGRYAGVRLRRTLLWHPDYLIDLVRAVTPEPGRRVDLVWHHRGARVAGPDLIPAPMDRDGAYAYLDDVGTPRTPAESWTCRWRVEGVTTRLWALDPPEATVLVATSPTSPPAERRATTVRRASGTSVVFVGVMETWSGIGAGPIGDVRFDRAADGGAVAIQVDRGEETDRWSIGGRLDTDDQTTTVDSAGHDHRVQLASLPRDW